MYENVKFYKATYLCSQLKMALNMQDQQNSIRKNCDCVIARAYNIGGKMDYTKFNFTMEGLCTEIKDDAEINIYRIPGSILKICMKETW